MKNFLFRSAAGALAVLMFVTNVVLVHATEANVWEQRRPKKTPVQLASLPESLRTGGLPYPNSIASSRGSASVSPRLHASFPKGSEPTLIPIINALPQNVGSVRKISSVAHGSGRTIVHIQDVHQNAEAQTNIAQAVRSLIDNKQIDLVALEGGFGPLDVAWAQHYPDVKAANVTSDWLLKEFRISGPVYAAYTTKAALPTFVGIDDKKHYDANVKAYRESAGLVAGYKKKLDDVRRAVHDEKMKTFNAALKAFDARIESYRTGSMSWGDYVKFLAAQSNPTPGLSPVGRGTKKEGGARFSSTEFPEHTVFPSPQGEGAGVGPFRGREGNAEFSFSPKVEAFLAALELEESLNFSRVESERTQVISQLVSKLSKAETDDLVAQSTAYQVGTLGHCDFYSHVKQLCEQKGIGLARFPAMDSYIHYVLLSDSLDVDAIIKETTEMENKIANTLATTEQEKTLWAESRQLDLTGKLLDFSLTKNEWKEYERQKLENRNLKLDQGRINQTSSLQSPISTFQFPNLSSFERFYSEAEARDIAMSSNLDRAMSAAHAKVAVVVTGGFHAEGIVRELQNQGATVVSYVPKITKVDDSGSSYLSVFAQEKTPLDQLFSGEKLFLATHPTPLSKEEPVVIADGSHLAATRSNLEADVPTSSGGRLRVKLTVAGAIATVIVVAATYKAWPQIQVVLQRLLGVAPELGISNRLLFTGVATVFLITMLWIPIARPNRSRQPFVFNMIPLLDSIEVPEAKPLKRAVKPTKAPTRELSELRSFSLSADGLVLATSAHYRSKNFAIHVFRRNSVMDFFEPIDDPASHVAAGVRFLGHGGPKVILSPDGRYLATLHKNSTNGRSSVQLFDARTLEEKTSFESPRFIRSVQFNDEGNVLVVSESSSSNGSVRSYVLDLTQTEISFDRAVRVLHPRSNFFYVSAKEKFFIQPGHDRRRKNSWDSLVWSREGQQDVAVPIRVAGKPVDVFGGTLLISPNRKNAALVTSKQIAIVNLETGATILYDFPNPINLQPIFISDTELVFGVDDRVVYWKVDKPTITLVDFHSQPLSFSIDNADAFTAISKAGDVFVSPLAIKNARSQSVYSAAALLTLTIPQLTPYVLAFIAIAGVWWISSRVRAWSTPGFNTTRRHFFGSVVGDVGAPVISPSRFAAARGVSYYSLGLPLALAVMFPSHTLLMGVAAVWFVASLYVLAAPNRSNSVGGKFPPPLWLSPTDQGMRMIGIESISAPWHIAGMLSGNGKVYVTKNFRNGNELIGYQNRQKPSAWDLRRYTIDLKRFSHAKILSLSSDGSLVTLSFTRDGDSQQVIQIYELASRRVVHSFEIDSSMYLHVGPDGHSLAYAPVTVHNEGRIEIVVKSLKRNEVKTAVLPVEHDVAMFAFAGSNRLLIVSELNMQTRKRTIETRDLETGNVVASVSIPGFYWPEKLFAVSPDGDSVLLRDASNISWLDLKTGKAGDSILLASNAVVAFLNNETAVVADGTSVWLWKQTGARTYILGKTAMPVIQLAVRAPYGTVLALQSDGIIAQFSNLTSKRLATKRPDLGEFLKNHTVNSPEVVGGLALVLAWAQGAFGTVIPPSVVGIVLIGAGLGGGYLVSAFVSKQWRALSFRSNIDRSETATALLVDNAAVARILMAIQARNPGSNLNVARKFRLTGLDPKQDRRVNIAWLLLVEQSLRNALGSFKLALNKAFRDVSPGAPVYLSVTNETTIEQIQATYDRVNKANRSWLLKALGRETVLLVAVAPNIRPELTTQLEASRLLSHSPGLERQLSTAEVSDFGVMIGRFAESFSDKGRISLMLRAVSQKKHVTDLIVVGEFPENWTVDAAYLFMIVRVLDRVVQDLRTFAAAAIMA